jgi:choline kinase
MRHAVVLAAGHGSRLRSAAPVKPLAAVGGRPLLLHALDSLGQAGCPSATVVVGHAADALRAAVRDAPIPVDTILNPRWADAPNGVSLLAAADRVVPGTVLMMADHLVSPRLLAGLVAGAAGPVSLAVDRRLGHPWVDEADVTRVRTAPDGRIAALGKGLLVYDAYDTGVFVIGPPLLAALASLRAPGLSEGVMATGDPRAVDVGDAPWLDVDDARTLALANRDWRP